MAPANYDRAFAIGTLLNLGFVILEAGFGLIANSMALLADAGHNLSDVLSLLLAWGAAWLTRRRPTSRHTYGFGSSSILASLTNAMLLLVAVGAIAVGAIDRLFNPAPVAEGTVIWVATAGILVNGITAWMFMRGRKGDINIRGAYLHMVADAGVSAGVVVAASPSGKPAGIGSILWPASPSASSSCSAASTCSRNRARHGRRAGRGRPRRGGGLSRGTPRGVRGARPAYLGHQHDRDGADRPSRAAGPGAR
jgi:cation diffusion facilitator family transporter